MEVLKNGVDFKGWRTDLWGCRACDNKLIYAVGKRDDPIKGTDDLLKWYCRNLN